ncbi:MAG: dihydrodipicolinate synthase family protein [Sphaerochaetaceae bacterium]
MSLAVSSACSEMVVMAGTGVESTRETIRLTKQAAEIGVSSVSLLMPNFFVKKMTDAALISHILEVADASPIPVVLYNNPSVAAGLVISTAVVEAVSAHANVAGIKDSGRESWKANCAYDRDDFSVLAGSAGYVHDLLEAGGSGGVLSLANVIPQACGDFYRLYTEGKKAEAAELNTRLVDLNKKVSGQYGVAGVKFAMDYAGFAGGVPRRPMSGLSAEEKKSLEADLSSSGFFN